MYRRGKCFLARKLWQLQHQQRHLRSDPGIRGYPGAQRWNNNSSRVRRRIWGGNSVSGISLLKKQAKKSGHIDFHFKSVSGSSGLKKIDHIDLHFNSGGGVGRYFWWRQVVLSCKEIIKGLERFRRFRKTGKVFSSEKRRRTEGLLQLNVKKFYSEWETDTAVDTTESKMRDATYDNRNWGLARVTQVTFHL